MSGDEEDGCQYFDCQQSMSGDAYGPSPDDNQTVELSQETSTSSGPSFLQLLEDNQKRQAYVRKRIEDVNRRLAINRRKQEAIRSGVRDVSSGDESSSSCDSTFQPSVGRKESKRNKKGFKPNSLEAFSPYFRDLSGLSASMNPDAIRLRNQPESVDISHLKNKKHHHWTKTENEDLKRAVIEEYFRQSTSGTLRKELDQYRDDKKNLEQFFTCDDGNLEAINAKIAETELKLDQKLAEQTIPTRDESHNLCWMRIATRLFKNDRTDIQCKLRWINFLHPSISHDAYSQQELDMIKSLNKKHKGEFEAMADELSKSTGKLRLGWMVAREYQSKLNEDMIKKGKYHLYGAS